MTLEQRIERRYQDKIKLPKYKDYTHPKLLAQLYEESAREEKANLKHNGIVVITI